MNGGGGAASAPMLNSSQVSQDQTKANVNSAVSQARLNNTNQVTPYGNLNYNETGGQYDFNGNWIPQFTATQTLSPAEQGIFNQTTGLQGQALNLAQGVIGQVQNSVNTPLDFSGFQQIAAPASQDQSAYQKQAYDALTSRSTQDLNRQQEAQKVQLANQGLSPGTDAYNNALLPIMREYTDASNQATINANQLAGQNISQQGQIINQDQAVRNQQIQEYMQKLQQPLQNYSALMGFGGGVQQPTYAQGVNAPVAPTDTTGPAIAAYQGQVANYNQGLQANNATTGGLFGLGGSLLGGLARAPGVQSFLGLGAAAA